MAIIIVALNITFYKSTRHNVKQNHTVDIITENKTGLFSLSLLIGIKQHSFITKTTRN